MNPVNIDHKNELVRQNWSKDYYEGMTPKLLEILLKLACANETNTVISSYPERRLILDGDGDGVCLWFIAIKQETQEERELQISFDASGTMGFWKFDQWSPDSKLIGKEELETIAALISASCTLYNK